MRSWRLSLRARLDLMECPKQGSLVLMYHLVFNPSLASIDRVTYRLEYRNFAPFYLHHPPLTGTLRCIVKSLLAFFKAVKKQGRAGDS